MSKDNIVYELVEKKGWSKYAIAKKTGVSWNSVSLWYKGVFKPNPEHQEILEEIFNEANN